MESLHLVGFERSSLSQRQQFSLVKNLVRVGVANPGDECLVPQQVLQLAGVPPDPLGEFRLPHGQRIGSELRPAGDGGQRAGSHPVDAAHLDGVEEAQFVSVLERDAKDGRRRHLLRPGRPLQAPAQHRVDDEVLPADVEDQELPPTPGTLENPAGQLPGELVCRRAQQEAELWRGPDLADPLSFQPRAEVFTQHLEFRQFGHRAIGYRTVEQIAGGGIVLDKTRRLI